MAHTHTSLLYHVVFSTSQRRALLRAALMARLSAFIGGVIRERGGRLLALNGSDDHVHLLASLPPTGSISDQIRDIKANSSGWVKDALPGMEGFAWQNGYSAFTVGKSTQPAVERYIADQAEHHQTTTFEEELVELLRKAGVDYDRRFVFD
jgi:REP element-mobilizing transposase RayT